MNEEQPKKKDNSGWWVAGIIGGLVLLGAANSSSNSSNTTLGTSTYGSDPIVQCTINPLCGGGTIPMRSSECSKAICCSVGGSWKVYKDSSACQTAQNTYVSNLPVITKSSGSSPTTKSSYTCSCGKTCGQMSSCTEAYYQLNTCGCGQRDGDGDGVPCEDIC